MNNLYIYALYLLGDDMYAINLNTDLILVNKDYALDKNYVPNNLVKINNNFSTKEIFICKKVKYYFEKMCNDALNNNLRIIAMSGYRDYEYQKNLYNEYLKFDKEEIVDTYSAKPGHSEHQTGLAIDVCTDKKDYNEFINTSEYIWLKDNCHKYGFIIRYNKNKENITGYKFEPWHIRYVGNSAKYIYDNNITLEEYLKIVRNL